MFETIKKIPIPMSGLMLACASLGNLLSGYNILYKNIFGIISGIMFICIVSKIIMMPKECINDLENPVIASVLPTLFMGAMILSTYIKPLSYEFAFWLWKLAVIFHISYILYFTKKYIISFNIKKVFASYFVVYVGIVAASLTSPAFKMESVGKIIFWFGFVAFIGLAPIIIYRFMKFKEMLEPAIPTKTILLAPANLCLAGYMSSFQNKNIYMIWFLTIISIITFVFVIINLPKMLKIKFYPSYSAFTFPFVITAMAMKMTNVYLNKIGNSITIPIYYVNFIEIVAVLIVIYVLIRYIGFIIGSNTLFKEKKVNIEG